ncbi:phage replisome organizer N-terminal domain-containing protein [Ignavigranum ruoffiae]|uniref:phage replisome organizer N-terminal domain-containing protein n=1 Tax=Ignavigranum ruoffiae TaxID=89093 RepID=UPI002353015D|nr:phage replisome organizer N-terminal domain-containing protein [Ignavigranum ruoffiae]
MSDNKRYYYLKLKDNFFDSDQMIVLESMPDGYKYSNILLKLYLRSLKHDGKLMFNNRIPYNSTILAQVTRHSVGDVEKAIKIFNELDLIEILENGAIYLLDIQNFIGESSTEADRIRAYRKRIESEKQSIVTNVRTNVQQLNDRSTPEIEIEKELEIDKDILSDSNESDRVLFKNIIDYLNSKANTHYRYTTKKTKQLIKARINDGFTYEDFKTVIDKKTDDWLNNKKMAKYLRPVTLFGTNFESYLNQPTANPTTTEELFRGMFDDE